MVTHIHVQNLGLVRDVALDFKEGFTVFTGETGAGKSLLLSSLLLLSGIKADETFIRQGCDNATIFTEWDIANNINAKQWLEEHAFATETNISLRRIIKRKGRTQCFVQGTAVSLQELSDFFTCLCEIHAQHEHQQLFHKKKQSNILYAFANIETEVAEYNALVAQLKVLLKKIISLDSNKEAVNRELDYLQYATKEIEDAKLQKNEDEDLILKIRTISHVEEMKNLWNEFFIHTLSESTGVLSLMEKAQDLLQKLSNYQKDIQIQEQRLDSLIIDIRDVCDSLQSQYVMFDDMQQSNLVELENRLALIEGLKKKYGRSIEIIEQFYDTSIERIQEIQATDYDEVSLSKKIITVFKELFSLSVTIHKKRDKAILRFQEQINSVLHSLAMTNARFEVRSKQTELYQHYYKEKDILDDTQILTMLINTKISLLEASEFYICTNKGMESSILSKIVSGGELSRIMLAITVVGRQNKEEHQNSTATTTLILDEVDVGLGGKTALALSRYLLTIAKQHQIICVTHLPTVAANAQQHILVEKKEHEQGTVVELACIVTQERKKEIARMLVGNDTDTLALLQAENLLK